MLKRTCNLLIDIKVDGSSVGLFNGTFPQHDRSGYFAIIKVNLEGIMIGNNFYDGKALCPNSEELHPF